MGVLVWSIGPGPFQVPKFHVSGEGNFQHTHTHTRTHAPTHTHTPKPWYWEGVLAYIYIYIYVYIYTHIDIYYLFIYHMASQPRFTSTSPSEPSHGSPKRWPVLSAVFPSHGSSGHLMAPVVMGRDLQNKKKRRVAPQVWALLCLAPPEFKIFQASFLGKQMGFPGKLIEPGKPGIALYFATTSTKKDTYASIPIDRSIKNEGLVRVSQLPHEGSTLRHDLEIIHMHTRPGAKKSPPPPPKKEKKTHQNELHSRMRPCFCVGKPQNPRMPASSASFANEAMAF